ncbi:hypothetical protein ACJX0J_005409, partial [Zea mays]
CISFSLDQLAKILRFFTGLSLRTSIHINFSKNIKTIDSYIHLESCMLLKKLCWLGKPLVVRGVFYSSNMENCIFGICNNVAISQYQKDLQILFLNFLVQSQNGCITRLYEARAILRKFPHNMPIIV